MKRFLFLSLALVMGCASLFAQASSQRSVSPAQQYAPSYWYVGGEFFSPMVFDDLYSWSKEPNRFHLGKGLGLKSGYQFSPVFGLELQAKFGQAKMTPNGFQKNYWLGGRDAYTYYPYTLIDGTIYHYPFIQKGSTPLVGEQGKNLKNVKLEGTPFSRIHSETSFWQVSLNASFNLTRLFYTQHYTERPFEVFARPGVYVSSFSSKVYDERTGRVAAPSVNESLTFGLGGDLALRYNINPRWSLELNNTLIWERDHAIDGVLNAKRAYDTYLWQPSVGVIYKMRNSATGQYVAASTIRPLQPAELLPSAAVASSFTSRSLDFWYPEPTAPAAAQLRSHSVDIKITYPLNKTDLVPSLHDNQEELARLERELRLIASNPNYVVRSIKVEGFASPEGTHGNNFRLGEGRARTLINYALTNDETGKLSRDLFSVGRMTENWDGLRDTLLGNPHLPSRDAVLALLDREGNTEVVKQEIKKIPGYARLLKEVYPRLRKSTYTIVYEVRDVSPSDDLRSLFQRQPRQLTADQLYRYAVDCGLSSQEGKQALSLLDELHGHSDVARSVRGIEHLLAARYEQALSELTSVRVPSPAVVNALGVAYAYLGQIEKARSLFDSVSFKNAEARRNLISLSHRSAR